VQVDDDEGQLEKMLAHIQHTAGIGHSFHVVVDPGDSDHEQKFFFDGDGAFRIYDMESGRGIKQQAADSEDQPKTLYVHRKLRDSSALREWALDQGFKSTLPIDDMHVTIAFSKQPLDWAQLQPDTSILRHDMTDQGRSIEALGNECAVVLRFESPALAERWQEFKDAGASSDHDAYRPHVTITYDAGDVDLSKVKPYDGLLEFDVEVFSEMKPGSVEKAKASLQATDSAFTIAMDRDIQREKTRDGRLIIPRAHIT
jgi:hypothetical protein